MNAWKLFRPMVVLLTAACFFFQQTLSFSLAKDFVIAQILFNIFKPRIVPLPIPVPIPLKFVKNTHKPYAVPFYSHSLSAHQVGHSYGDASGLGGLTGVHDLSTDLSHLSLGYHDLSSSLSDVSYGHHGLSSSFSEIPDLTSSYKFGNDPLSTSLSQISGFHLPTLPKTSYDSDLSVSLSQLSSKGHHFPNDLTKYSTDDDDLSSVLTKSYDLSSALLKLSDKKELSKKLKSTPHNIQGIVKQLEREPELLHEDSIHVDNVHDDIEAIGGLDLLTDLDSLGGNKKWW